MKVQCLEKMGSTENEKTELKHVIFWCLHTFLQVYLIIFYFIINLMKDIKDWKSNSPRLVDARWWWKRMFLVISSNVILEVKTKPYISSDKMKTIVSPHSIFIKKKKKIKRKEKIGKKKRRKNFERQNFPKISCNFHVLEMPS